MTVIANNCMGGCVLHTMNLPFNTPTINLQIFPEEFPKFCENIREYLKLDVVECKDLTEVQKGYVTRMYGSVTDVPYGMLGDVLIQFMHYKTFEEALDAWNRRRVRVDYDNMRFLFHLNQSQYAKEAEDFIKLGLPHSVALTESFEVEGSYRFDVPDVMIGKTKLDAFGCYKGKPVIENGRFDRREFLYG